MSQNKKVVRKNFRDSVFKRDGYKCLMCGYKPVGVIEEEMDSHHITNRDLMPHGGYVASNGASLCKVGKNCHLKAENEEPGFEAEALYAKIGSSYEKAVRDSERILG